jgi:hypothetical protein
MIEGWRWSLGGGTIRAQMLTWARTDLGRWAVNLDGSAPSCRTFPRLEVRCHGERRWAALCMLPEGTCRLHTCVTMLEAQRIAIDDARALLGSEYGALLDELVSNLGQPQGAES